jgi:putative spermidine/putrescine transport system permease protein|tara:strand:- start:11005 stop:12285 length:1281 start_codon:yes stop_codon:yes gene_type:complete
LRKINNINNNQEILTTADGVPLKASLNRALRRERNISLLLVTPLFVFVLIAFLFPIADMLFLSVDNKIVVEKLPRTVPLLADWDETGTVLPDEQIYKALVQDINAGTVDKTILRLGRRLNFEQGGMSSLFRRSVRKLKRLKEPESYKAATIRIHRKWGDLATWRLIKRLSGKFTPTYFYSAVDGGVDKAGHFVRNPENQRIYLKLFVRTILLSLLITLFTIILGYPISYLLATLPTKLSNLLMILVLLPFWTSLLVRTTSWITLLQREGVINDLLVWIGVVDNAHRLTMIHNQIGTIVAMTHILLPFMVLPLFSVMKTIPPNYMRAARSMGATQFRAFLRIYLPNTVPGIGAGCILVFILSIGYYITPSLVGGTSGTFISNLIAYHVQGSLNWGLGAALGTMLLMFVLALYVLYDKVVGLDNIKLG